MGEYSGWNNYRAGRIDCKHIMMLIEKYVLQMAQTDMEVRTNQSSEFEQIWGFGRRRLGKFFDLARSTLLSEFF